MSSEYRLSKLTWPEVSELLQKANIVIVPVGSTEQHGRHIPVDNDHYTATEISKRVALRLRDKVQVVVCPTIPYGISQHHMGFPGTISLRTETFIELMKDVCRSLISHGFRKIVIINGHGGNTPALQIVISELTLETKARLYQTGYWEIGSDIIDETCGRPVFHADEHETSLAFGLDQRVVMAAATDEVPKTESSFIKYDHYATAPKVSGFGLPSFKEITNSGTIGYATRGNKENGTKIVDALVERFCDFLLELNKLD
jgi:creatinine amidohydrolase